MDWAQAFTERFISTPAIHWLDEDRLGLSVDNQKLQYSLPQKSLISLIGRAIKRGQDLGVFVPCLGDADLALILTYTYALWVDVRFNLSVPGKWMNRRVIDSKKDVMVIGNGPSIRKLLVNRCHFGKQPIHDYIGIHWLARSKSASVDGLFAGIGSSLGMDIYIVPKTKVSEHNFSHYKKSCQPFVIIYELTSNPSADRNLIEQFHIIKDSFPSVPVIFICSTGDMAAMKMLRDEKGVVLWVNRANDIASINNTTISSTANETPLTVHSNQLSRGIAVTIQIIKDNFFNDILGELLSLASRIYAETSQSNVLNDKAISRNANVILKELTALAVPLNTQEELHRFEKRASFFATRMLRNRVDKLGEKTCSVGTVNVLLNNLVRKLNELTDILVKPDAITGKTRAVPRWVSEQISNDFEAIIACPNESTRAAMISFLSSQHIDMISDPIFILTHNQLWRKVKESPLINMKVLWIGTPDFYCGAFFGGIIPDLTLMIYLNERDGLEKQLGYIEHNTQKLSRRSGDKLAFLRDLSLPIEDRQVVAESVSPWTITWEEVDLAGLYPGDLPVIDPFILPNVDWMAEWLNEPMPQNTQPTCDTRDPCVVITLSDGEADITLPRNASVLVLDEISDRSEGLVPVSSLHPGLTILVPRDDPQRSLLDRLIDNLRNDPEFYLNEKLAERWYLAIETIGARTGYDTEKALRLLQKHHVDVETEQTINNWFNHKYIGTGTTQSLIAVAKASNMLDVINNTKQIWNAIKYVRKVRRILLGQIAKYISTGMSLEKDKLISKELNLYSSDLEELTRIGEILHITRR